MVPAGAAEGSIHAADVIGITRGSRRGAMTVLWNRDRPTIATAAADATRATRDALPLVSMPSGRLADRLARTATEVSDHGLDASLDIADG